jgi:ABC-type bacteriocin/lantibiotic exporter with double-glycine peptidase domain
MVLAGHGTVVSEADLEADVQREAGGTEINQLKQLAQKYGLVATIQEATAPMIGELLAADCEIISYVNRAVFDLPTLADLTPALRNLRVHAVVPIRVTARHITFLDPRQPAVVRKTIRRFGASQRHLRSLCLVFSEPEARPR